MKLSRWLRLTTLTALGLGIGLSSGWQDAIATTFDKAEVDQNRFILLANAGGSRLTILEQVSNARACWQEQGSEVDPLLLNFDFTGICGRYSDLNGYSVRVNDQDLGLTYRLQVANEGDSMVLYAMPRRSGVPIAIGRTRGIPQEFGEIELFPGWRVTRRVYNGRELGHIYLTNDQTMAAITNRSTADLQRSTLARQTPTPQPTVSQPEESRRSTRYARRRRMIPTRPVTPAPDESITIPVDRPAVQPPSSVSGSPLPPPPTLGGSTRSGDVAVVPVPVPPPTPSGDRPPGDNMIPVVPITRDIWFTEPPVFEGTPQPASNLASNLGFNYRLIVSDSSPDAQRRVRSVVPDAFRTVINGQVVMQAGLFYEPNEANDILRRLNQQNLPATLIAVD